MSTSSTAVNAAIRRLAFGESLSASDAADAFDVIMRGEATPAQVAALLMGLRIKGETADEVAGAATALRRAMIRVPTDGLEQLVDTCGTGGGAVGTFNISTAAGLLAAGLGVRVAKHGNRSFTSQCGSADVLEALGIPLDATVPQLTRVLHDAGIVFMFAPAMHPAMRFVGPVRRELAIPTVMNIVGPLANPAGVQRQVLGVAEPSRLPLLAGALAALGTHHALVVHGEPGMDEISPLGETHVVEVCDGGTRTWRIDPAALGFPPATPSELAGGSPTQNAALVRRVLEGEGDAGARTAVILNAAAAVYVAGGVPSFDEAVEIAREGLAAGVGVRALDGLVAAYARAKSEIPS